MSTGQMKMFNPTGLSESDAKTIIAQETKRVEVCYSKLGIREPFIAAVMSKVVRIVGIPGFDGFPIHVTTAATNGTHAWYNALFTRKFTDQQVFGLVFHESCHVVLMHMWRRGQRDPGLWNYGNDAIINRHAKESGYDLPDGGVWVDWVSAAMDSEYVYRKLMEDMPKPPPQGGSGDEDEESDDDQQGSGSGDGDEGDDDQQGSGSGAPQPGGDGASGYPKGGFDGSGDLLDAPDEATKADIEATIQASATMAKMCGQGSALIDLVLKDIGVPKIPWTNVLRNMLGAASRDDYTWKRPNRRHLWNDLYLPSLHSEKLGGLIIGIDTSGSMSEEELKQAAGELNAIIDDMSPTFVEVIWCDSKAHPQRIDEGDPVDLTPKGGGGTSFAPVFDYVAEFEEEICAVLYFTDMCATFTGLQEPAAPTIWINTYHKFEGTVPFGVVIDIDA
jgi:predicted metal-dependent peptidase